MANCPMRPLLPQELREKLANLANRLRLRRRSPWNWCIQNFCAALFPLGLVGHSPALLVLSVLGIAAGCIELPLPPMEHTGLARLLPHLEGLIGAESAWLARPFDRARLLGLGAALCLGLFVCWLLWSQDLAPIALALGVAYLLHVRRQNIRDGIDP